MKNLPKLAIVVPCYNEEAVLPETSQQLSAQLTDLITSAKAASSSYILFIDDGSQDNTWGLISAYQQQFSFIKGIKLSRNFGHQAALLCGLTAVADQVDCAISIDADLQDDLTLMESFIAQFQAGYDIVYGVRKSRENDTFFKKYTALAFYQLMQWLGTQLVANHADYRLISQRALKHLIQFNESSLFLRGIMPLLGFKSTQLYYNRQARFAGATKYSLAKMLNFALNGITAITATPLRLINLIGVASFLLASLLVIYFFDCEIINHHAPVWLSILLLICLMGSVQLLSLGFIGEYLGKIYNETKNRPNYIIARKKL
jgi:glycosyltransferase involved in cell wall biosynthesis